MTLEPTEPVKITVRLPAKIRARLKIEAVRREMTLNALVLELIGSGLAK